MNDGPVVFELKALHDRSPRGAPLRAAVRAIAPHDGDPQHRRRFRRIAPHVELVRDDVPQLRAPPRPARRAVRRRRAAAAVADRVDVVLHRVGEVDALAAAGVARLPEAVEREQRAREDAAEEALRDEALPAEQTKE